MATILWIIAVILVIAGVAAIFRGQMLWGIVLIVVGLIVGPAALASSPEPESRGLGQPGFTKGSSRLTPIGEDRIGHPSHPGMTDTLGTTRAGCHQRTPDGQGASP